MSINLSALMKQRYDTAANWTAQNPTLLAGEIGIESDTKKWKVGTGATAWTSLVYAIGGTYPIVNADVAAAAAIVDTKLATIATAGKVSNSATTATNVNTASAIVARDASGNFTAGTITAALTGAASANVLKAGDTMTGVLAVTAGTAALPGIAVSGDPNTGIYSPGADQLAISTNGTGRLFVDSAGLVGVNQASPGSALDVNGEIRIYPASGDANLRFGSGGVEKGRIAVNSSSNCIIETAGTERLRITSAGLVGIGSSAPGALLNLQGTFGTSLTTGLRIDGLGSTTDNVSPIAFYIQSSGWGTQHTANIACGTLSGTNGGGYLRFSTSPDGNTAPAERLRITATGLVGIGTTDASSLFSSSRNVRLSNTSGKVSYEAVVLDGVNNNRVGLFADNATGDVGLDTGSSTGVYNGLSFFIEGSKKATIDRLGRLLVGTSSARGGFDNNSGVSSNLQVEGAGTAAGGTRTALSIVNNGSADADSAGLYLARSGGTAVGSFTAVTADDALGRITFSGADGTEFVTGASIEAAVDGTPGANDLPSRLVFSTTADGAASPTEQMRIGNQGTVFFGTTAEVPSTANVVGATFYRREGLLSITRDNGEALSVNRKTSDGNLVVFHQDGTVEGTITVSGTTVSYNGAHLSRWSQLPSGVERTEILRGSVLSNIDEMCEWDEEDNEQLNRMKVSDVEGDKNVSGVFQAWDDDDDTYTDDFYCAMTGDFIIRIAEGVTVERGDLLMSAGDGTAKPQDDDIIRSKTVAKVTSTNVSCTYEDGSYCVPCVLMAC
jgi:hypothetical protein